MSTSRVLSVDELSEAQLRCLVSILQISHPDAVASAMALLNPTVSNNQEKEEKSADAVDVKAEAKAVTEEIPVTNKDTTITTINDAPDAKLQENTPLKSDNNYVSSDDSTPEKNDGFTNSKFSESPPHEEENIPMEADGSLEETPTTTSEATEVLASGKETSHQDPPAESKNESPQEEDSAVENYETTEIPQTDDLETSTTPAEAAVDDEISKTLSSDEPVAEIQAVETNQPDSGNDAESPSEIEKSSSQVESTTTDPNEDDTGIDATCTTTKTDNRDATQETPGEMITTVDSTVSEGAVSNASPSERKKQKKRPPGKKRPPKATRGGANNQESNEAGPKTGEEGSPDGTLPDSNVVEALQTVPKDASSPAHDPPIIILQRTEVAEEKKQDHSTEMSAAEEVTSSSQDEQLEATNDTNGVSASDETQPTDVAADPEATSPPATEQTPEPESPTPTNEQPEEITTHDEEPTTQLEPEEGEATRDIDSSSGQNRKRPPGKKRPPENVRSDDDVNNDTKVGRDPPGQTSDSAQASGAAAHEVIAWESEQAADAPTEDCFFNGYSGGGRSEDVTAEAYPEAGCYLVFDSQGGGKLVLHYSKTPIAQAIGFFSPGEGYSIQGFKFTRNQGRVELIGNCASGLTGRKNYYSGWCQFIRAAKDLNGTLWVYPPTEGKGLDVDVYVYLKASLPVSSVLLPENRPCCVSEVEAVACLPKHAEFISNARVALSKWMEMGNAIGTTIQLPDTAKKTVPTTEGLFVPGKSEAPSPQKEAASASAQGPMEDMGCYLVYDADGCKLIQHYSKTKVPGAIGFFAPGPGVKIPGFKFTSNQGRAELIGNCSGGLVGRKNYFAGWCQFVRAAKAMKAKLWVFPKHGQAGLDVDVFVYTTKPEPGEHQTIKLQGGVTYNMNSISAVACLPKHAEFFDGLTMDLTRWVEEGSKVGATIQV